MGCDVYPVDSFLQSGLIHCRACCIRQQELAAWIAGWHLAWGH